jgi:Zn-dependent protease with chaperone function
MDFFEHQQAARRRTRKLVLYYLLAVALTVVAASVIVCLPMWMYVEVFHRHWGRLLAVVAVATIGVIAGGTLCKMRQLSGGGEAVARMLGGRLIDPQTRNLAERRLLNVVEEMALASGVPVPPVYVLDKESSINAFAAGREPGDAVIAVSRGCLTYLNRDELQGVTAHELSHILNGDMRLNLRLVGILFGVEAIFYCVFFLIWLRSRSDRAAKKKAEWWMYLIVMSAFPLILIGAIGYYLGAVIRAVVSRQREYLADASAVQFTRLPDGIAGALKKIGGLSETSKIEDIHAAQISHMFFGNASGAIKDPHLATHPPLVDRIRRIDPGFDGKFPKPVRPVTVTLDSLRAEARQRPGRPFEALAPGATTPLDPGSLLAQVGTVGIGELLYAAAIIESIPEPLHDATRDPDGARAVIYALLLDRDAPMRKRQLEALKSRAEERSYEQTERLAPLVDRLPDEARLPLVEMRFPALKMLSPEQYVRFRKNVEALIKADSQIELFEYAVHRMLLRHLDVYFRHRKPTKVRYHRLDRLLPSLTGVLSTLTYAGQKGEADVRHAFEKGMAEIGRSASLLAKSDCSLRNLDAALTTLAEATPKLKRDAFRACAACVAADGKVTPREGQLLQAVAGIIGVPVPPIVAETREARDMPQNGPLSRNNG